MKKKRIKFDKRLLGTWKSDRRLTFKHYIPHRTSTPAKLRRFKSLFGKLTVRWTKSKQYADLEGFKTSDAYEVVASDSVSVVVRGYSHIFEETRVSQIFFEKDHYWFWTPWGWREFFRRVE
jgi:hypothetical protein